MLICKGTGGRFKLDQGRWVSTPGGILHDPSGGMWSKCSALIIKFPRDGGRRADPKEMSGAPKHYFGRGYEGRVSKGFALPSKSLSDWKKLGTVSRVEYTRGGIKAPGRYYHNFGSRRLVTLFRKPNLPTLYKLGRAYRLELGSGCIWSDLGFVTP